MSPTSYSSYVFPEASIAASILKHTGLKAREVSEEALLSGAFSEHGGTLFVGRIQPQYTRGTNDNEQHMIAVRIDVSEVGSGTDFLLTDVDGSSGRRRAPGEIIVVDRFLGTNTSVLLPYGQIRDLKEEVRTLYFYSEGHPVRAQSKARQAWTWIANQIVR